MKRLVTLRSTRADRTAAPGARSRKTRQARALRTPGPATPLSPDKISAAAVALGQDRDALGPDLSEAEAAALSGRIDAQAAPVAGVLAGLLPGAGPVEQRTGVRAKEIEALLGRRTEAIDLHRSAMRYLRQAGHTQRAVGQALRELVWGLVARTRREVEDPRTPDATREELTSDAEELLGLAEREEARQRAQRDRTRRQGRARAAFREAQIKKGEMLRTLLALQRGEEVDEATLDEAAETYAALRIEAEAAAPARRARRPPARAARKTRPTP